MMKFLNYFLLLIIFISGIGIFIYIQELPSSEIEVEENIVIENKTVAIQKVLDEETHVDKTVNTSSTKTFKETMPTLSKAPPSNNEVESLLLPLNNKLDVLISNLDKNLQGKQEKDELVNSLKNAKQYRQLVLEKAKQENMEDKN